LELEEMIRKITEEVYGKLKSAPQSAPKSTVSASKGRMMEYAVMNPAAKVGDIRAACETARAKGFRGICVPQWFVGFAVETLKGSELTVATIVGQPGGASSTHAKYAEVKEAVKNGAGQVFIPVNMDLVKKGKLESALNDLNEAMTPARGRARVAAVVETGDLQATESAIDLCLKSGAEAVGLSCVLSGLKPAASDVKKIADKVRGKSALKVIGGVDSEKTAGELMSAGAEELVTSCMIC